MNLLIDVGNNYLKWALVENGHWDGGFSTAIPDGRTGLFDSCWGRLTTPQRIVASNVRGEGFKSELSDWCQSQWRVTPEFLEPAASAYGIVNSYHDPQQLGPDRWAALIGARALADGVVVVVDCGTAITVDTLSADNVFLGGAILPGLTLAGECLLVSTRGIGASSAATISVFGRSTAECVSSGVNYGLAGGIDRLVGEIEKALNQDLSLYLTGGDAVRVQPLLKSQSRLEPELVLKGLLEALNSL